MLRTTSTRISSPPNPIPHIIAPTDFCRRTGSAFLLFAFVVLPALGWADDDDKDSLEQIVVTATRAPTSIRDEPPRVEAVPAEEIEENLTEQPGNLTSLLNELPSV